ncbi:hypothetical protein [Runella sp. SP2]|uniref:hypothetical protein n=1 Tax=Runella sp. SP2 TaxID=2268026 RepID=UPI000F07524B|nr:hypothetical protein [Runella sp. SP2]AYQ31373.1 hypothetical protein DTQ70_03910 [Runella sp. SP2]
MPESYKSIIKKLDVNTTFSVYTVPSATTAILQLATFANVDASNSDSVEFCVRKSGDAADVFFVKGPTVPFATTFRFDGPIVLNAGDILKIKAATANRIDVTIHLLEIS